MELAIGNGRVAIPVAQGTGKPVIGTAKSRSMLEQTRVNAAAACGNSICDTATCVVVAVGGLA